MAASDPDGALSLPGQVAGWRGVLQSWMCRPGDFAFDRHWMVVDTQGRFLTQRQQPRMSLIRRVVDEQGRLQSERTRHAGMAVRWSRMHDQRVEVTVWGDSVSAVAGRVPRPMPG